MKENLWYGFRLELHVFNGKNGPLFILIRLVALTLSLISSSSFLLWDFSLVKPNGVLIFGILLLDLEFVIMIA